jgi:hypothetical protein
LPKTCASTTWSDTARSPTSTPSRPDLEADIANIDSTLERSQARYQAGNEAMAMFASGYKQRMADFHFDIRLYSQRDAFTPAVNGIQQLRSAGGVRLIGNRQILDALQHYQTSLEGIAMTQDLLERTMTDFRVSSAAVMDFRVNFSMHSDPTNADRTKRWTKPTGNPAVFDPRCGPSEMR